MTGIWKLKETFDTAYNDGDLDKNNYSKLIGFSGDKVYYWNTSHENLAKLGVDNYYLHGALGEKFPSNLTAAFSIPSNDSKVPYFVYLFREDKYCFRSIKPEQTSDEEFCPEWRNNSELFGCLPSTIETPTTTTPTRVTPSTTESDRLNWNLLVIIVVVVLIIIISMMCIGYWTCCKKKHDTLETPPAASKNVINFVLMP